MLLQSPIPGARISDTFGPRAPVHTDKGTTGSFHYGIDLAAKSGTPITAAAAGRVTVAAYSSVFGYWVHIDHGDGLTTRYAHMLANPPVKVGQHVITGQLVGLVGSTGQSTGPHLHFETRIDSQAVDPLTLIRTTAQKEPQIMATLIRTPDGTIAFVSDAGKVDAISDLQEVEALKAAGLVTGWVQQPDRLVLQLLQKRTDRLNKEEADRIAAAITRAKQ